MPLVVTACTLRKRFAPAMDLLARDVGFDGIEAVSREWLQRLGRAAPVAPGWQLYCGRGFQEAIHAARVTGKAPAIVSAGLGVLNGEDMAPSYNLTVSPNSIDDITARSTPRATAKAWWSHLVTGRRSLADRLRSEDGLIIVALPKAYFEMVAEDLLSLPSAVKARLRIISGGDVSGVSDEFAASQMPYDARFDGSKSPNPGTRADFASRAARHFAEFILASRPGGSVDEHKSDVDQSLFGSAPIEHPIRRRVTDEEITSLLRSHWGDAQGQTARLLRLFRDDLGIACEQGRFSRLVTSIRREREA